MTSITEVIFSHQNRIVEPLLLENVLIKRDDNKKLMVNLWPQEKPSCFLQFNETRLSPNHYQQSHLNVPCYELVLGLEKLKFIMADESFTEVGGLTSNKDIILVYDFVLSQLVILHTINHTVLAVSVVIEYQNNWKQKRRMVVNTRLHQASLIYNTSYNKMRTLSEQTTNCSCIL